VSFTKLVPAVQFEYEGGNLHFWKKVPTMGKRKCLCKRGTKCAGNEHIVSTFPGEICAHEQKSAGKTILVTKGEKERETNIGKSLLLGSLRKGWLPSQN